jgi:hypothetical protein
MDADEFRQRGLTFNIEIRWKEFHLGKEMVDFIADYLTDIRTRRVFPNVKPGYMRPLIDEEAPRHGEAWDDIFKDIERVIMPGVWFIEISLLIYSVYFSIGNTLAIAVYACIFSGIEFLSILTRSIISLFLYCILFSFNLGYVGKWIKSIRIYMGM